MFKQFRLTKPIQRTLTRFYHSSDHIGSNLIVNPNAIESKVLSKALEYVPKYGFTQVCITEAIRGLQYPDSLQSVITSNPRGNSAEFELVLHWLKCKRQELEQYVINPNSEDFHKIGNEYERASHLIKKRLLANEPIIEKLQSGLSQLVVPGNIPQSMEELHNLSDDIAFYAGDKSNDFAWYSKRMGLSTVYVSSELFMLQDTSEGFQRTQDFVDEKVAGLKGLGSAYTNIEEWSVFNAISLVNLIKSQLLRG